MADQAPENSKRSTNSCPVGECDGSGWHHEEREDGSYIARPCRCQEQRRIERLFQSARIPRRYQGARLATFDATRQPKAFQASEEFVRDWEGIKERGGWLFLVGPVGTGKSHLAYAALNELVARGVSGLAATVPDLMQELRPKGDDSEDRMDILKSTDLLVLDDLGAQKNSEWVTERLFILLNARYADMRPTIITSNEYLEDLAKGPGWPRLVDRIIEAARVMRMDGTSYRQDQARQRRERR